LETKEFYERIGFRAVCYLESDQPHICLYRDSIEIILTKSGLERITPNREAHGYGYDAYFVSTNQAGLYAELGGKKVKIVKELDLTDYGNREFVFEDNEGRWIAVGCKEGTKEVLGLELGHVAFYCEDIGAMERFYSDVLEVKRVRVFNEATEDEFFILGRDNFRIELFKKRGEIRAEGSSFKHFAVGIKSMDNLMTLLSQKSVPVDRLIDCSTAGETFKICFVRDPEGNVIEFMEGYRDR
jgi:catechol 2,3-dioxygenase-like lactoylglutathione lyase family enzyme